MVRKAPKSPKTGRPSAAPVEGQEGPVLAPQSPMAQTRARADTIEAICVHLRRGKPLLVACALERVPRRTFYNWLSEEPVSVDVEQAKAEGSELHRRRLERHIRAGDSKGANVRLNLMATLYDSYAPPKQRVEQTGADGGPIEQTHAITITRDEAISIARKKDTSK